MKRNWTKEEDKYILDNYDKLTWTDMANVLECTINTVEKHAEDLGITINHKHKVLWTEEEVNLLREYSTKYVTKTIAKKLNKSILAVRKKAIKEGIVLHGKNDPWKKWMIDYLKDNINNKSIRQISIFIGLSEGRIRNKCIELGLDYDNKRWTKEEVEILKKYYRECHYSELTKVLPNKSKSAILCKARDMNLDIITETSGFNETHAKFVRENWGKISINEMARTLGVSRSRIYNYKSRYNLPNIGQKIKWNDENLKLLEELAKTKTITELAKYFNTSNNAIISIASLKKIKLIDSKLIWTEEKINEVRALAKDHTINEITAIMNLNPGSLNRIIKKNNIEVKKDNAKNIWTDEEINTLIQMTNNKASIFEIIKVIKKTDETIIKKCKELNLDYEKIPTKGWTEEEIINLKEDAKTMNIIELIIKYERSKDSIRAKLNQYNIKINSLVDHWTEEEVEILKNLVKKNKSIPEIAKELNRTSNAVENKIAREKINNNYDKRYWTKEEENFLIDKWDEKNILYLSKKLKRSISSIRNKARSLGLKDQFLHPDALKIEEIAEIFNVKRNDVETIWIILGLPYKVEQVSNTTTYKYVLINDLFKFLENNQFLYDGKDFEENILGKEPEWVKLKRKHDYFYGFDDDRISLTKKKLLQKKKYFLELEKEKSINENSNTYSLKKSK